MYTFSPYDALNGSKYDLPLARNLNLNMKLWHPVKTFTKVWVLEAELYCRDTLEMRLFQFGLKRII